MVELQPDNVTILFVDDNPDIRFLMDQFLTEKGYQVQLADRGQTALSMLETSPPDLMIIEADMEGMGGSELTRQIREHHQWRQIPIIILFGRFHNHSQPAEKLEIIRAVGANAFIETPIEIETLLETILSLLRENQP